MAGRNVQVRIGGTTYRVVTSASDEDLQRLAAVVDQKLATVVPPGRPVTPQAMLLAAMALAHDLEEERARSAAIAAKARGAVGRMIERVDSVLGGALEAPAPFAASPQPVPTPAPLAAGPVTLGPQAAPNPAPPKAAPALRTLPREGAAAKPRAGEAGRPANES
jgi:cell division protein ZapA